MQESLLQTADAGVSLSVIDAGVSPSDSGCSRLSIGQRMQETLYQTADAGNTPLDSGCRRIYQTADAGDSLSGS